MFRYLQDLQDGKETGKPKYIAKYLQNRGLQAIDPNAYTREWCTFWLEEIYNFTYVEFYKYANPVFSLYFEKKEERKRERRRKRYEKNRKKKKLPVSAEISKHQSKKRIKIMHWAPNTRRIKLIHIGIWVKIVVLYTIK